MKSYTDIEQSKKLAEILPLESADMTWEKVTKSLTEDFTWKPTIGLNGSIKDNLFSYRNGYVLPCWSLAALLKIIPYASLEEYNGCWGCNSYNKENHAHIFGKITDNPVDACYDIILKLNKNN